MNRMACFLRPPGGFKTRANADGEVAALGQVGGHAGAFKASKAEDGTNRIAKAKDAREHVRAHYRHLPASRPLHSPHHSLVPNKTQLTCNYTRYAHCV
jgi:hypothetical protein